MKYQVGIREVFLFLVVFNFYFFCQANNQPHEIKSFPALSGILARTINHIVQDQKGFMWFATWEGLYRFDGYNIRGFKPNPDDPEGLNTQKITTLYQAHDGIIWVGTRHKGLYRFDPETETFTQFNAFGQEKHNISNSNIWSITEDDLGRIWAGTENGLICLETGDADAETYLYTRESKNGLSDNFVRKLFKDSQGKIWVGTTGGLFFFTPDNDIKLEKFDIQPEGSADLDNSYIYCIEESMNHAGDQVLWIGTKAGLKKIMVTGQGFNIRHYFQNTGKENSLSNNYIIDIETTKNGDPNTLWIATNNGLNKFDYDSECFIAYFSDPQVPQGLNHNRIRSVFEDRSGVLWVGSDLGINFIDLNCKKFWQSKASPKQGQGLKNNIISAFVQNKDNSIWIGTYGAGMHNLTFTDNKPVIRHLPFKTKDLSFESNFIFSLCVDTNGNIWAGTDGGGVFRFREEDISNNAAGIEAGAHFYNELYQSDSLIDNYVLSIHQGYSGNLWFGTWSMGLFRFVDAENTFEKIDPVIQSTRLSDFPLTCLYEDQHNVLWIGTRGGGLFKIDNTGRGRHRHFKYDNADGCLANNYINAIYEDHQGNFWICTEVGVSKLDRKLEKFAHFYLNGSQNTEVVQAIQEDNAGNLWLSSHSGLYRMEFSNENATPAFKNYDYEDGLQHNYFNNSSSLKDYKGRLYFGGVDGFTYFYPDSIRDNRITSQVAITRFLLFNREVMLDDNPSKKNVLKKSITYTDKLELAYNENSFSFEFTSLHYANTKKNKYAYMLSGLDEGWIYTNSRQRIATYTNIDHGEYTFFVKSSNNDGLWSDSVAVDIVIHPPVWKTKFAYLSYALLILLLLFISNRLALTRSRLNNRLKMERYKREKSEELNQIKTNFFTNISHEFRTPLTLILGPVNSLLQRGNSKEEHLNLNLIKRNTQRLLRLVDQLLDFQKLDSGQMKLKIVEGDLKNFIRQLCDDFNFIAEEKQIQFSFSAENDDRYYFDKGIIEKILLNLLTNAFKHTNKGGSIHVGFSEDNEITKVHDALFRDELHHDCLEIAVNDSGEGISEAEARLIFKRFYKVDKIGKPGWGIGLALVKELAELHFGQIVLSSKAGFGSTFIVRIPISTEYYKPFLVEETNEPSAPNEIEKEIKIDFTDIDNESVKRKKKHVVLVIEDNEEVCDYIHHILSSTYKVVTSANGLDGFNKAIEIVPDVIVSDIMMPGINGLVLCEKIKENKATCHIPVILLTARSTIEHKIEGLKSGADSYIPKPFYPEHLLIRIKNLIDVRQSIIGKYNKKFSIEPSEINLKSKDEVFLNDAIKCVEQNLGESGFTVDHFCKEMGMSRMQLYRKLMAITGKSPLEFIRNIRIKRAAQLIEKERYTIAEITYMVGFIDLQYFRKCFKEEFGKTPSQFHKDLIDK